jgi:membrane fusion protein (multidrug efflux system)
MTPKPDSTHSAARKILLLLACSSSMLIAFLGFAGCNYSTTPERVPPPPSVTVVDSKRMTVPIIVNPIGTTRALEEVTIRARVRGFLTERHFEYGTNVKKDQLLLVIDEIPFKVALAQVKAQLNAASASLEKAQSSKAVEVAKATLALDQAQMRLDEVEERRERILLARKASSQEDYDKAQAQKLKSAAKVEADRASLEQTVADYKIDIDSMKAELARAQAAVDDAQINLSYCKMYAPIAGRIGELKVKVGNLVGEAGLTELVTVQQLDPMGLDLHPPARYLPEATALLGTGVAVSLTVEGERRHPHVGKAIFIDNRVDDQTATFLLRAEVPNPVGTVLPGEYIRATMTVGQYVDAVVVPEQAVLEGQEGTRVFVVDAQNKVDVAKVTGVDSYRGLRVLEAGLEAGQRVIVEGVQLVRQGQKVDVVPATVEKFMTEEVPPLPGDQRFNSRVSRVPGRDAPTKTNPTKKATTEKTAPDAAAPGSPVPKAPDSETQPQPPATRPAGKQPR